MRMRTKDGKRIVDINYVMIGSVAIIGYKRLNGSRCELKKLTATKEDTYGTFRERIKAEMAKFPETMEVED